MANEKRKMTIGKQITFGFGLVLVALAGVSIWAVYGIGNIVGDASEVIDGNKIRAEIIQREVDHLNWAGKVNALLTNEAVTKLDVQTDPHKCGFGTWYYGEGRKHAEHLVPSAKKPLAEIEDWHTQLHESAIEIGKEFQQADLELSAKGGIYLSPPTLYLVVNQ